MKRTMKIIIPVALAAIFIFGVIAAHAQDANTTEWLTNGDKMMQKLSSTDDVNVYEFTAATDCATVIAMLSDDLKEGPSMTMETLSGDPIGGITAHTSGGMFRLPPGSGQYRMIVHYNGLVPAHDYWVSMEKDCSETLDLPLTSSSSTVIEPRGGDQTMNLNVPEGGSQLVIMPSSGASALTSNGSGTTSNGGSNGGNNGGNNGGGNGNNGGSTGIGVDITIIIRDPLTGHILNVFPVRLNAGIVINLPAGNFILDIASDISLESPLELSLSGDVTLAATLPTLTVTAEVAVDETSLVLDAGVDANIGGENGLTVTGDVNATVGGTSLVDVNANANVGGSNGINANANANVGGTSLVDVNANASVGGSNGVNVNANANVGGSNLVDVNANVNVGSAPVVDANVTVGGSSNSAPVVDVNANVAAPVVDVNANVSAPAAPAAPVVQVQVSAPAAPAAPAPIVEVNVSTPIVDANASVTVPVLGGH